MPRTSGYKNRGLNNPNSYRNRNKSSETSNKGAETINPNSGTVLQTTSTPTVSDSGFKGDNRSYSGKYLRYPVKMDGRGNTGDRLLIKCVEYITPSKAKDTRMGITINEVAEKKNGKETGKVIKEPKLRNFGMTADARTRQQQKTKYFIELPIPQDLNDSTSVTWGEDTLNMFELAGLAIGKAALDKPAEFAAQSLDLFTSGVRIPTLDNDTQEAFKAAISGRAINALGSNVTPRSIISRSTGQVLNSNLELLFQGVNLRTFPFSVTFSPRSPGESGSVRDIIRSLKQSMSAKAGGTKTFNGASASGLMIKAPDVFILEYRSGGRRHPFLNNFKTCALTSINVNYTNAGTYATYNDSTPVNIRMDMVFKELNPIYAEDYDTPSGSSGVGY